MQTPCHRRVIDGRKYQRLLESCVMIWIAALIIALLVGLGIAMNVWFGDSQD